MFCNIPLQLNPQYKMTQNSTSVTEFILLGLSSDPQAQLILFGVFLIIYLIAVVGNILILLIISLDVRLHNPMYFFLCNLSVVDIGYITSTVPKMLMNYLSNDKRISFSGCLSQMYFFISFGGIECLLLGIMAYDRYAAVCHPLHYSVLMRPKVCIWLAVTAWILGMSNSGVHTGLMTSLSFCQDNVIQHFFCDIPPLFQLSCTDTQINQIATFVFGGGIIMGSFLVTLLSYVYIALAILRIRTKEGRRKAFSTYGAHLAVVNIYFGTLIFTYIRPNSTYSQEQDHALPVLYGSGPQPPVRGPVPVRGPAGTGPPSFIYLFLFFIFYLFYFFPPAPAHARGCVCERFRQVFLLLRMRRSKKKPKKK